MTLSGWPRRRATGWWAPVAAAVVTAYGATAGAQLPVPPVQAFAIGVASDPEAAPSASALQQAGLSALGSTAPFSVEEASARFNENMEAMRHNFLFRKYFNKLEKEQQKLEKQQAKEERAIQSGAQ